MKKLLNLAPDHGIPIICIAGCSYTRSGAYTPGKGSSARFIQQLRRRKKLQGIPRSTAPQGLPSFVEIEIHRLHVLCIIRAEDLHCLYWYPCFYQMDAGNWSFLYIGDQCLPIV
jgi:hypothetical protein